MIRLPAVDLPAATLMALAGLQQEVNAEPTYEQKVVEGKRLFALKSRSQTFRPIRDALGQLCAGARRCCYCEDSQATDIEHIWPKDFYPEIVFSWENYLYACTRCNRPKSYICDIYLSVDGSRVTVPQFVKQHKRQPPIGDPVLINPRRENPLDFMILDMSDTFFFVPHPSQNPRGRERAEHTIKLLKLNEEDVLPKSRAEAYAGYRDRFKRYVDQKLSGKPQKTLQHTIVSLQEMRHPTVWHEMKRQRTLLHHQEINHLFVAAPEALEW